MRNLKKHPSQSWLIQVANVAVKAGKSICELFSRRSFHALAMQRRIDDALGSMTKEQRKEIRRYCQKMNGLSGREKHRCKEQFDKLLFVNETEEEEIEYLEEIFHLPYLLSRTIYLFNEISTPETLAEEREGLNYLRAIPAACLPEMFLIGWPEDVAFVLRVVRRDLGAISEIMTKYVKTKKLCCPESAVRRIGQSLCSAGKKLKLTVEKVDNKDGVKAKKNICKIDPKDRTIPMSYKRAAKLMGKGGGKDAAEWLAASVKDGSIPCEHISRQAHVFAKHYFPQGVWAMILPESSETGGK